MWGKDSLQSTKVWKRLWPYVVLFSMGTVALCVAADWWAERIGYKPFWWLWARLMEPFNRVGGK
jgi:hypothetical protein